ncbi:hypothetical protein M1D72_00795 [Vibrio sp. AK197]
MDKSQRSLDTKLKQLKQQVESDPRAVLIEAQQCVEDANTMLYPKVGIRALIVVSLCYWHLMDYRKGLKSIKDAYSKLSGLDTDDYVPEILHIHALHYWGQAQYYSAQQFWINALEQSALTDETEIQIESLIGLGNVWRMTNEYQLARSTHELAVIVANNMRINYLEGKARILLAWDHYLLHQFADMLSVLDGAAEALRYHDDKTWHAEIWDFRGLALLGLERIKEAEQATQKAQELAEKHDLSWMKSHSYISRARLELLRKNPQKASELLMLAEVSASEFDNGELLSQICYQQSLVAEEIGHYQAALVAFKKYRQFSLQMQREQTLRVGTDKARTSKRQMEQRARKLINRVRRQHEFDPEQQLSQMVSETYWWEQLVLHKTAMSKASHSVIVIKHSNNKVLEICTELAHSLCQTRDLLTRLSQNRIALLLAENDEQAHQVFYSLSQMFAIYPWHRQGLDKSKPSMDFYDILSFPFTLDHLDDD